MRGVGKAQVKHLKVVFVNDLKYIKKHPVEEGPSGSVLNEHDKDTNTPLAC